MVKKIGIIRCDSHSENCAGFNCFPALRDKTGQFENYDKVELVGFDTCGGCDRGKSEKIVSKAIRLKEKGAEVIHLGNCLIGSCPVGEQYIQAIKENLKIDVIRRTHP
jgi:predicted metal-binding protein